MISAKLRRHVFSAVSHNICIAGARSHVCSFGMNIYPGDVVYKDVLKSFHNLLQGGEGTSAKKLGEDLDIRWASKGGNVDLSKRSKDDFSTGLIPDYITGSPSSLYEPHKQHNMASNYKGLYGIFYKISMEVVKSENSQ